MYAVTAGSVPPTKYSWLNVYCDGFKLVTALFDNMELKWSSDSELYSSFEVWSCYVTTEVQELQVWSVWWRRLSYVRHFDDTLETNINIFNSGLMSTYLDNEEKNGGTVEMDFWEVRYKLDLHGTRYSKGCVFCWNDDNALAYEIYKFLVSWIIYHLLMFSHSYL
jgi:hypothetical protein